MSSINKPIPEAQFYIERARQYLNQDNEAAYMSYLLARHFNHNDDEHDFNDFEHEYQHFLASTNIDENRLKNVSTDFFLERINRNEYQETFNILCNLIFHENTFINKMFRTNNNIYLYILLEISLFELSSGYSIDHVIMNRYDAIEDFSPIYRSLVFLIRRIWFHIEDNEALETIYSDLILSKITLPSLIIAIKYTVSPHYQKMVYDLISDFLAQRSYPNSSALKQYDVLLSKALNHPQDFYISDHLCTKNNMKVIDIDAETDNVSISSDNGDHEIAFFFCANNETYTKETLRYLNYLNVPDGYELSVYVIRKAKSMAAGYNLGMSQTNAKYKIYIHQDTFIIDPDLLFKVINVFKNDTSVGLIGLAGSITLPHSGVWWDANPSDYRACIFQDNMVGTTYSIIHTSHNESKSANRESQYDTELIDLVEPVKALDGIFLATSKDLPWREDLFDHWHFYDISQCMEFLRTGLKAVYIQGTTPAILHELSVGNNNDHIYEKYQKIFCQEYHDLL